MTDYELTLEQPLQPGDRLIVTVDEGAPPPPPPPGALFYDHPSLGEVAPDLPPLPSELHNPSVWHGLAIGVTVEGKRTVYRADHEHGQPYPGWAFDLFGNIFEPIGQSLSYPWQTPNENLIKHEGYKYMGWDWRPYNLDPRVPNAGIVEAAFIQTHVMGTQAAALARFHSFYGAFLLRPQGGGEPGILITGGHQDFGQLTVPYKGGPQSIVPLADAPTPAYDHGLPPYRGHTTLSPGDQGHTHWNSVVRRGSIPSVADTYHRLARFAFRQRFIHQYVTDGIQTPDPEFAFYSGGDAYDPITMYNSSIRNLYQVEIDIPDELAVGGLVNFTGFTNVKGEILLDADEAGPNEVPIKIINAVPGSYVTNFAGPAPGPFNPENFYHGDFYFDNEGNASRDPSNGRPAGWIGPRN